MRNCPSTPPLFKLVSFFLCVCCVLCFVFQALNIHFFNYFFKCFFFFLGITIIYFYICNRCMEVNLYKHCKDAI